MLATVRCFVRVDKDPFTAHERSRGGHGRVAISLIFDIVRTLSNVLRSVLCYLYSPLARVLLLASYCRELIRSNSNKSSIVRLFEKLQLFFIKR
jgi:hypothetical protein